MITNERPSKKNLGSNLVELKMIEGKQDQRKKMKKEMFFPQNAFNLVLHRGKLFLRIEQFFCKNTIIKKIFKLILF